LLIPITVWIACYAWRPFFFGFYSDDWFLHLGCDGTILSELVCVDPSRPVAVLIRWTVHQFIGVNPAGWQIVTTGSLLAAALTLMVLLRHMLLATGIEKRQAAIAGAMAAAYYLAFPWMLGVAWATATSPNFATTCFNLALCVWFARWPLKVRCLASAFLFFVSSLTYEIYWFVFLPFAGMLWLRATPRRTDLAILTASLTCAQLIMIGFNRLVAILGIGTNKSFDSEWLYTLSGLWPNVIAGLREIYGVPGRYAFAIMLAVLLACVAHQANPRRVLATLGPLIAGIAISVVLLAIAGYPIRLTGISARITIVISWWLAVAVAFGTARTLELPAHWRRAASVTGLAMLILLAGGSLTQSRYWADSWATQVDILRKLPRERILSMPGPAVLVVELPSAHDAAATFYSPADLSGAIWLTDPQLAEHLQPSGSTVSWSIAVPTVGLRRVRTTRNAVSVYLCETSELSEEYRSPHVLHWRYPEDNVRLVAESIDSPCVEGRRLPP